MRLVLFALQFPSNQSKRSNRTSLESTMAFSEVAATIVSGMNHRRSTAQFMKYSEPSTSKGESMAEIAAVPAALRAKCLRCPFSRAIPQIVGSPKSVSWPRKPLRSLEGCRK
jgi:hypothetical protein